MSKQSCGKAHVSDYKYFSIQIGSVSEVSHVKGFVEFLHNGAEISELVYKSAMYKLKNLGNNLRRRQTIESARVKEQSKERRVTEEDIAMFYKSSGCTKAISLLEKKSVDLITVKIGDYILVRNFLIFRLIERNFLRPCSLHRLPTEAVLTASKCPQDEAFPFYMALYGDKTIVSSEEPSYVHLTHQEMQWLLNFINNFRGRITPVNKDVAKDLFLSQAGSSLNDKTLSG